MDHLEPTSIQKSTIVLDLVPVYDEEMYQRVAPDNISQTRKSKPPDRSTRICFNDHILGQFLKNIDPTWVLEYIKKRETNELASQIILWKQKAPSSPPGFQPHDVRRFYGSRGRRLSTTYSWNLFEATHCIPISKQG
jgi:hypothetical protein